MKKLRFGAVYGAPPIFNPDLDRMGYVEVSELKLPPSLAGDINVWNQEFQKTFCEDYPPDSGFDSLARMAQHNTRGAELALLLQKALGGDTLVQFIPLKE
jgi:hypothetical protein